MYKYGREGSLGQSGKGEGENNKKRKKVGNGEKKGLLLVTNCSFLLIFLCTRINLGG